jgi:hypothetical protein
MNLQVISAPDGEILWVSGPLPGAVHDLTAARIQGSCANSRRPGWRCWRTRATPVPVTTCAFPTGVAASPPRRKTPTAPTPSYAALVNAPTPSSRPGASCANSAAVPGRPGNWRKLSTSFKPARSEDEKGSLFASTITSRTGKRPDPRMSMPERSQQTGTTNVSRVMLTL